VRRMVPFCDDRGHVVPWGYVFLTDGLTVDAVAELFRRAWGRQVAIGAMRPDQARGAACGRGELLLDRLEKCLQ
jgi:hypothetical protein